MKLIIGSDQNAYKLKEEVKAHLIKKGVEVEDIGVMNEDPIDYPDIAEKLADRVATGEFERGILLCGTGIGMALAANKVNGIRAAVCHDLYSTERSRKSNDCQIMCMGAQIIGLSLALSLVDVWLNCDFLGGGSAPKVDKIMQIEAKNRSCR